MCIRDRRNYIYTVADIYKIFFDAIQKKLEAMVGEIDSLVDKNPDFIATEGKFKGCIFYQTDTDSNSVDVLDVYKRQSLILQMRL